MSNFQTAKWVCDIMVGLLPAGVSTVLEPTPGEASDAGYDIAKAIRNLKKEIA